MSASGEGAGHNWRDHSSSPHHHDGDDPEPIWDVAAIRATVTAGEDGRTLDWIERDVLRGTQNPAEWGVPEDYANGYIAGVHALRAALSPRETGLERREAAERSVDVIYEALATDEPSCPVHGDICSPACTGRALSSRETPVAGLDVAWAEAEAALPGAWVIRGLAHGSPENEDEWVAGAGRMPFWDHPTSIRGYGPTPSDALRALAARLREPSS